MAQALKVSHEPISKKDDASWRSFPEFEKILGTEDGAAPLMGQVEKTCRLLNEILQSGSATDRARARQAMTAYGRALDLFHLLAEMRDRSEQK